MNRVLRNFYAATLAGGLLLANVAGGDLMAKERGKSGLPPGPGNPIAAVYKQIQSLEAQIQAALNQNTTMWINHLDLVPGGLEVDTAFDSTSSGVGSGLSGLIITSTTIGETFTGGGNKVVEKGLDVPPNYRITGVRICYETTNSLTYISQIRLAQLQNPPSTALVLLDDATDHTNVGPTCVDSTATSIDPSTGAVSLSLRVNFANVLDKIVIRGIGLHLQRTKL
jgi:hypothetical protein